MLRPIAALACLILLAPSCAALRHAREPWEVDLTYQQEGDAAVAQPRVLQADGPFGRVQLSNFTSVKRGFAIEELAVYEQVLPDRTIRFSVDEARDGRTYRFYDHLHPEDGPRGRIVVRFVDPDEQ